MENIETNQQKKMRFIELRANGYSLRRCAKELGVGKGTACNWAHELAREIGRARAVEWEALMEQYGMLKEARIEFLATQLDTIRKELDERGLSDVPTAKILEAQLTYFKELMAEAVEIELPREVEDGTETSTKLDASTIALSVQSVIARRRAGTLSAKDAKEELLLLETLRKSYEHVVLEQKFDHLRLLLEDSTNG